MIVVFVVDTSPSMNRPVSGGSGMSRLDLAKMVVEDLSRRLRKGSMEHNSHFVANTIGGNNNTTTTTSMQRSISNIGQGASRQDALLLLSTSRQHPDTASCAAGGRLLVGFGRDSPSETVESIDPIAPHHHLESFQRELKGLKAAPKWDPNSNTPFPEDAGGAVGLNAALSAGLQLLSRYRLQHPFTEHFGMGRLPNIAIPMTPTTSKNTTGSPATAALQPACLVLVTDGACLRANAPGGGTLQLQYGSQLLREFYKEPFRWDQRIYCLAIGDNFAAAAEKSGAYLHPQLRALCEVTGGSHWLVRKPGNLPTEVLWKHIRPPLPKTLPLPDPLYTNNPRLQQLPNNSNNNNINITALPTQPTANVPSGLSFVNGGPICCFQAFEAGEDGRPSPQRRAMLLYTASNATTSTSLPPMLSSSSSSPDTASTSAVLSQPLWCIPESYFPSKKLDTLPPRSAQPLLMYSKYPAVNLGSKSFEPVQVIKMLHRLDQLIVANRKLTGQPARCLHRDVYICEWLAPEGGGKPIQVSLGGTSSSSSYFPVFCPGAGRPTIADEGDNYLNIGILHAPPSSSTLASQAGVGRLATLTLLPPEPHILLPLLLRAAEAEHRVLKKANDTAKLQKTIVPLDEHWRSEFQAYTFRLPPYYQHALKRCLRHILPPSAHTLLHTDAMESLQLQCFSKVCLQKIRNAELIARETNERLERQEASLRIHNFSGGGGGPDPSPRNQDEKMPVIRYGQFDPRSGVDSYLAALRHMPPPWRVAGMAGTTTTATAAVKHEDNQKELVKSETASILSEKETESSSPRTVMDTLGDLPAQCLMAYYESRRRWIFGGPSLSTRGLHVEGVSNDGSNSHRCGRTSSDRQECLLSIAGVGVSVLNETSTTKMGDYRERLLFSRSPVVGYGSNDAAGVSATTAVDGSPVWSVDDDAMPTTFFNSKTGQFADSVQARVRSRLMVNFGNPYKEKRADSLIPEQYYSQAPSMQQGGFGSIVGSPMTPPGSPPHDSFDSPEEGEAIFVRKSPSRSSPKREEPDDPVPPPPPKRPRSDSIEDLDSIISSSSSSVESKPPAPPRAKSLSTPPPPKPTTAVTPSSRQPPPPKPAPPKNKAPRPPRPPPSKPGGARPHGPPPPKPASQQQQLQQQQSQIKPSEVARPEVPAPKPNGPPPAPPFVAAAAVAAGTAANTTQQPETTLGRSTSTPVNIMPAETTLGRSASAPHPHPPPPEQKQIAPPPPAAITEEDLQTPDKKPNFDLPAGWMCVWSKSQKRWYFFDTKTNKSVWKWPP